MFDNMHQVVESQSASQVLLRYPASGDNIPSDEAAVNYGSTPQQVSSAIVVIRLLDRAAQTLNSDQAAAARCIARASALLQAEHSRIDHTSSGAVAVLPRGGLAPWQARKVSEHIDAALAATIRAGDCARIARLSTSYFARAFKVSFGETFFRYVIRCRTERAQELMVMTDRPLCEIALDCGFADQSHFSRLFRRLVGASPAAWRRQRRGAAEAV
jgi:AraC family transcriptional regulator